MFLSVIIVSFFSSGREFVQGLYPLTCEQAYLYGVVIDICTCLIKCLTIYQYKYPSVSLFLSVYLSVCVRACMYAYPRGKEGTEDTCPLSLLLIFPISVVSLKEKKETVKERNVPFFLFIFSCSFSQCISYCFFAYWSVRLHQSSSSFPRTQLATATCLFRLACQCYEIEGGKKTDTKTKKNNIKR